MGFSKDFSYPTASYGYYRGSPQFLGTGSGGGGNVAGKGTFAAGQGMSPANADTGWQPTVLYLLGLIVVEMVVFGVLAKHL